MMKVRKRLKGRLDSNRWKTGINLGEYENEDNIGWEVDRGKVKGVG